MRTVTGRQSVCLMEFAAPCWSSWCFHCPPLNRQKSSHCSRLTSRLTRILTSFPDLLHWPLIHSLVWLSVCLSVCLQFSFSFVETHTVSAVRIRPRLIAAWPEEDSEEEEQEESDSKTTPIIQSEEAAFPWNMDGELVEIANEVLVRYNDQCDYYYKLCVTTVYYYNMWNKAYNWLCNCKTQRE